jgi:hypothetical protein
MTEQIQNLSLDMLAKASEKYENIKEVFLELDIDGETKTFKVEMYKHFSPLHIKQCVSEFIEKLDMARRVNKYGLGNIVEPYMIFLLIKHFTTLQLPEKFEHQLKVLEQMVNTGVLFKIFVHFDENEVELIRKEIDNILNKFKENEESLETLKKEYKLKLTNKDLLE